MVEPEDRQGESSQCRAGRSEGSPTRQVCADRVDRERGGNQGPVAIDKDPADGASHDNGENQHREGPSRQLCSCLRKGKEQAERDVVIVVYRSADVTREERRGQHRIDEERAPPEPVPDHENKVFRRRAKLRVPGCRAPAAERKRDSRPQQEDQDRGRQ